MQDHIKLSKRVIEVDFRNMNHALQNIKDYKIFSFGIIISTTIYEEYQSTPNNKKKNTTYFLMEKHCINNNFEFIIYDLQKQNIFIEEQEGK